MEENKLTEEQIKYQQEVDKVKEALLESIRLKDPKLYYRITHKEGYKPWRREDYFISDIRKAEEINSVEGNAYYTIEPKHKISRNELCHCGSGQKVKHCHGTKTYYTIPKEV